MKAEIIAVGTELLLGNTVNTNATFLAQRLQECGVESYRQVVVGDNITRIADAIKSALSNDIILICGGLGPTGDDVTRDAVALAAGKKLYEDQVCRQKVSDYINKAGTPLTENNFRQALLPEGAVVLHNENGSAESFYLDINNTRVYVLPGPPRELKPIFDKYIAPEISGKSVLVKRQLRLFGIWESALETKIAHYTHDLANPSVGIYASHGGVMLQVTARAKTLNEAENMLVPVVDELCDILGDDVYGIDVDNIEHAVVNMLTKQGKKLAVAESCTGGLIAKRIVDRPGASAVFDCGVVSYSNDIKNKVLGVSKETLEKYGAVSSQTAAEMARGVLKLSGADIAVSVTGIAGPDGGTPEKPVGTVWYGIADKNGVKTFKNVVSRDGADRNYIREYSASYALNLVRKHLSCV
ncbi:MAG: competence/damage-inducible protein A [Clostridia bacterium]|nr:competence/damage-inducible protein A [Clostridia bacterium]